ncbi:MAG: 50S ribosomal protein L13 [Nitrospirota bacterium]|nr:50S ribosomal protein L13 [Nitrospirota bacterium]MDE3035206.1 50S ribosomal protein L13 [Nitrospirota bacterium]MDE3118689.1 50S ribosomal protein L13 [Nitrospirota bacterium]MDE3242351.1 50S ribosomal protein L13 [Nitrospirota bacterium]
MGTYLEKPADVVRKWYLVDANGKTLGRLAARVATVLRGKHKPTFTPHVDTGDHVVVINAGKVHLTGDKMRTKLYINHSGYPGGLKTTTAEHLHAKNPTELLARAIKGMLPKNTLGKQMARKLKVYPGAEHPHHAQRPEVLAL